MAISSNSNSSGVPEYNEEDNLWFPMDLTSWTKTYDSATYAGDTGAYSGKTSKNRKAKVQKTRSNFGGRSNFCGNQFGRNQSLCNRPKNFQGRRI